MNINNSAFLSNLQIQEALLANNKTRESSPVSKVPENKVSFNEVLNRKLEENRNSDTGEIKFSKHAMTRLETRNISITDTQLDRLNEGARKAGEKGIRDSLVLVDELAFIVNVPNNTVVTAMDQNGNDENIFTNIDGAVIA